MAIALVLSPGSGSATAQRRDGHHPIIGMQIGPVRFAVESRSQATKRPFAHHLIARETRFQLDGDDGKVSIQDLYSALVANKERNQLIVNDVINALEGGRSPLLLTERRDHLEYFESELRAAARNLVVLRGGMGVKQRREVADRIAAIPPNQERLVLATGRYIGEGFDDARLDTLFGAVRLARGTAARYSIGPSEPRISRTTALAIASTSECSAGRGSPRPRMISACRRLPMSP